MDDTQTRNIENSQRFMIPNLGAYHHLATWLSNIPLVTYNSKTSDHFFLLLVGSWYENTIFHLNNRLTHWFSFHFLWSNVKWFSECEVIKDDKFNNMLVTISFATKTIYNWINQIRINSQIKFLKKITNIYGWLNTNNNCF